jgi:hypothetical protein
LPPPPSLPDAGSRARGRDRERVAAALPSDPRPSADARPSGSACKAGAKGARAFTHRSCRDEGDAAGRRSRARGRSRAARTRGLQEARPRGDGRRAGEEKRWASSTDATC